MIFISKIFQSLDTSKPSTSNSSAVKPSSFEAFRRKKEQDRSSKFKPKPGGKRAKVSREVKIQVGLVRDKNGDGVLLKVKSRTITLAIDEDSDVDTLLAKAIEKHTRHHQQFDRDIKYVLLYHDMSMVKNLPRSNTPFVLSKYQKDLLIPYSKMYFWLCSQSDFESSLSEESTDTEVEMIHVKSAADPEQCSPAQSSSMSSTTSSNEATNDVRQSTKLSFRETLALHPPNVSSRTSSRSDQQESIDNYLVSHQCPTCLKFFSRAEIEVHADVCAENWIDPIGDCGDLVAISDSGEETLTADELSVLESKPEVRRDVIEKINSYVKRTSINRITIRRREAFQDFWSPGGKNGLQKEQLSRFVLQVNQRSMVVGQGGSFLQARLSLLQQQ